MKLVDKYAYGISMATMCLEAGLVPPDKRPQAEKFLADLWELFNAETARIRAEEMEKR